MNASKPRSFSLLQWEGYSGFSVSHGRLIKREDGEQIVIDKAARVVNDKIVLVDARFLCEVPASDNVEAGSLQESTGLL